MVVPPDTASIVVLYEGVPQVLYEGVAQVAPRTQFQVTYGRSTTVQDTVDWVLGPYQEEDVPRERSPHEEQDWSRGRHGHYNDVPLGPRGHVTGCGLEALKVCVVHVHNILKWGSACTELRSMYKPCLGMQVDIVCGDGSQAWYFRSKAHKQERTD